MNKLCKLAAKFANFFAQNLINSAGGGYGHTYQATTSYVLRISRYAVHKPECTDRQTQTNFSGETKMGKNNHTSWNEPDEMWRHQHD